MNTIQIIQEELAKRNIKPSKMMAELGFSSGLFSQWKSGKQNPSMEKIQKIANYLNVSTDYLLNHNDKYSNNHFSHSSNITFGENLNVNISSSVEENEMEIELLKAFRNMSFADKMDIMNYVLNKNKGE